MKLGIDFRFYRPEPYGLANYISGLWSELIPLLKKSKKFTKIYLFMDSRLMDFPEELLVEKLANWKQIKSGRTRFKIIFTPHRYYSLQEQTLFLQLLNSYNLDLMFFFTANFPVFYNRPYVYQIFDFTHFKQAPKSNLIFKIKTALQMRVIKTGLKNAKSLLFLGDQTKQEALDFTGIDFVSKKSKYHKPNEIVWASLEKRYFQQKVIDSTKAKLFVDSQISVTKNPEAEKFFKQNRLGKNYGLFISVWKKHKNLTNCVLAFEKFASKDPDFKLVICGRFDPANSTEIFYLKSRPSYQSGQIIFLENLPTENLIWLIDKAKWLIHPSFSEGFGISLIEAASRGTPIICSKIQVFKTIMQDLAFYFDPNSVVSITKCMQKIDSLPKKDLVALQQKLYQLSQNYTWEKTAKTTFEILENSL